MSFEIIDCTDFSDSTSKFRSVMLRMAARGQLGPFINTVDITDTIKMTIQQISHCYRTYDFNPTFCFQYPQTDEHKQVKLEISGLNQGPVVREFTKIHEDFQHFYFEANRQNIQQFPSYYYKNQDINIKVTVKEPLEVSATEMAKDYSSLLNSQTLSDFKFKVDGVDFHVHKVILAGEPNVRSFPDLLNFISYVARSPVFMKMFTGDFQESKLDKGAISDISHKAFLDFLRFLYTNSVDDLKSYVLELLSISDLYEVEGLKKMCESQLMSGLNEENAPDIFQYAHRYRCDNKLKVTAFALIKKYEYTRSFARNNFNIPDEFLEIPKAVQEATEARKLMDNILKVKVAKIRKPRQNRNLNE